MPVYNEKDYIEKVIRMVKDVNLGYDLDREIIVVDDGSNDGTREILKQLENNDEFKNVLKVIYHEKNQGKGGALNTGFNYVSGDIVVIQDADLEYDPNDWREMLRLIIEKNADVVYGSRFYGASHRVLYFYHFMGNKVITYLINLLFNMTFSDIEVCYKMLKKEILDEIRPFKSKDFGFEVEITAKISKLSSKKGIRVYETQINYYGRTYNEGKKITWKDGIKALWYIIKFRFSN
ncbi:MAG: glycosyltransferase family 2 protein [candidate division WOR-3 bacterium]|nr:glycosyltransferase family 2 protein [candidate division WOR-3 bacterium]